jgi:DNA-binding PadR family transcriptional regulator
MASERTRDLTTLEYIILGLLSLTPQTGYGIISVMERAASRWSGSPGAIYPALKRLESQGIISSHVDASNDARPRRLYRVLPPGEHMLDEWLRVPVTRAAILDERDLSLLKFTFAERRLTGDEVLTWLDAYEKAVDSYDVAQRIWYDMRMLAQSVHQQLLVEATMMELNTLRAWIQMAQRRLRTELDRNETVQPVRAAMSIA